MATEVINPQAPAAVISSSGIPFAVDGNGRIDVNAMRPFRDNEGNTRVITNSEGDSRIITNAGLLQFQEWLDIDRTVIQTANRRLVGIADLQSRGLIHALGSIGQTVSLWDRVSEMDPANINMSGITAGQEDTIAYATQSVPVPIVHKDFRVNLRRLEASRLFGESVDVTAASVAARLVAEASEAMLFSGNPITVEDGTIYGYRNFPGRGTVDRTAAPASATPAQFKADVQAMLAAARLRRFYGPYTLYVSADWEGFLDEFYIIEGDDGSDGITVPGRTVREVILALSGIERIVVADFMGADGEAVLVQLERDVVDLAVAQDITTINWQAMGGMQERFKVMAAWVPRIKSDFNGNCGIIHLRPA
jgi:uncharacterized linocin/CFP29 family protein